MGWGSKTQIMTDVSVAGTEQYSTAFTLNPGELVHVEVEGDFVASPTDNLIVKVYGTLDDSTENWDDTPFLQFQIDKGIDPNKVAFIVRSFYKCRLGCIRDGATDTITVNAWYRSDGVSL